MSYTTKVLTVTPVLFTEIGTPRERRVGAVAKDLEYALRGARYESGTGVSP